MNEDLREQAAGRICALSFLQCFDTVDYTDRENQQGSGCFTWKTVKTNIVLVHEECVFVSILLCCKKLFIKFDLLMSTV